MILPFPRTGPSSRCRLQFTTKIRLSSRLARGQRDGAERFRFVHFAVAEEGPDFAAGGFLQAAIFQILDEARVIDRLDRAQAHRDGGELPEIGHQPGMRIGRQTAAGLQFAAEILQLLHRDAAFEKSARVDSRRGVSLEIDDVAIAGFGLAPARND